MRIVRALVAVSLASIVAVGCSSGGSSGDAAPGSVAVLIGDGPAEDFAEIWLTVHEITLIPGDVVLFESTEGEQFDLLQLRDEDLLLTVRDDIPARRYNKIRLRVSDVQAVPKDGITAVCSDLEIKLPSGRIDLNPRGGLDVAPGDTVTLRLDIDANKSIGLHAAGASGKCIFRPVVFVDIDPIRCLRAVTGTIFESDLATSFRLDLGAERDAVDVSVDADTTIFDAAGAVVGPDALTDGLEATVRGRLAADGVVEADLIVLGDVLASSGIVSVEVSGGAFTIDQDGTSLEVQLSDDTLIVLGCDEILDPSAIAEGMRARVLHQDPADDGSVDALAVFLKPAEVEGDFVGLSEIDGAMSITLQPPVGDPMNLMLPAGEGFKAEGVGPIDPALLHELVACGPQTIHLAVDPHDAGLVADARLTTHAMESVIDDIDFESSTLFLDDKVIAMTPQVIVVDTSSTDDRLLSLADLAIGNSVRLFGLNACDDDEVDVFAVVVIVLAE